MEKATDKLNLILIELPKFKKTLQQLEDRIDQWLYCFKHLEKLQERPKELSGKVFETLFEEAEINKLTPEEMGLYIKRYSQRNEWNNIIDYVIERGMTEKAIGGLDEDMVIGIKKGLKKGREKGIKAGIRKGMKKGIEKGMSKGMEKGMEKGAISKSFEIAKNLLNLQFSVNDIVKATGLTPEQILSLQVL